GIRAALGVAVALAACTFLPSPPHPPPPPPSWAGGECRRPAAFRFPRRSAPRSHARALAGEGRRYIDPQHGMIDKASGYPFEGWNHDPKQTVFLRSFTQLTAIGQWMELLAYIAAGQADTPFLTREQALAQLIHLVATLRDDQKDP